jgi:hypothetical protein
MDRPRCKTCQFWEESRDESDDEPSVDGWCHRHPPALMDGIIVRDEDECVVEDPGYWVFPKMNAGNWCGEHPDFPAWLARQKESTPLP